MSSLAAFTSQAVELHLQLPIGEPPGSLSQLHLTPSHLSTQRRPPLDDGVHCPHQQMTEPCVFQLINRGLPAPLPLAG